MHERYRRLGDFVLLRKIATGGMAEVHLAIKRGPANFDRLVALKSILEHRTDHETFVSMFYNEARLGARFSHPNLVNVFDVQDVDGALTMVMEYVPGATVSHLVQRCSERGLTFERPYGIRIVLDACLGLYHAHHLRDLDGTPLAVVHRDVSPQNILVGYNGQVKVFDFGIAHSTGNEESEQLSGVLAGKYAYMSPEQCHGGDLDERSDVFSLGILLWELTTQKRLFRRKNQIEVLRAITEHDIPSPRSVDPDYPEALEGVVMAALDRDPDKRPQTALELHDGLLHYGAVSEELISSTSLGRHMEEVFNDEIHTEWASLALALQQIEEVEMAAAARPTEIEDDGDTAEQEAVADEDTEAGMALEDLAAQAVGDSGSEQVTTPALHSPLEVTLADALRRSRRLATVLAVSLFLALAGASTAGLLLATGRRNGSSAADIPPNVGQLAITSEPEGATIFLDGVQRAELTPAVVDAPLGLAMEVRLDLPGYSSATARVTATPEAPYQNLGLTLNSERVRVEAGTVRIVTTPPDAAVTIDGALRGRGTPLLVSDLALAQPHVLRVERAGHATRELTFDLTSSATREIRVELQATVPLGQLSIRSNPTGARVLIDGQLAGLTPMDALPLVSGRDFSVELQLDGYRMAHEVVNLGPDEERLIEQRLRPRRRDRTDDDTGEAEPSDDTRPEEDSPEEDSPYELLR